MDNTYSVYGLTVRVPFSCPSLPLAPADAIPDVTVVDGAVPRELTDASISGEGWQAASGRVLMQCPPSVGRFLAEHGTRVILERAPEASDEVLAVQFFDAALAMVLQQRGYVVMHGNAAITPTGAVVVCGTSGVGKSTTLTALLARGCAMLTDDITACCRKSDNRIEVQPGMPHLHLCAHSAEQLGQDITGLPQYPWRRMKAVVPTLAQMSTIPAPLRALYVLRTHDEDIVRAQQLFGMEKFAIVTQQLYGPLLPEQQITLFPLLSGLVQQVNVYLLWRPAHRWSVEEVVDEILSA